LANDEVQNCDNKLITLMYNEIIIQRIKWAEHVDKMCGKGERIIIIVQGEE
jgi:hypothetical protein